MFKVMTSQEWFTMSKSEITFLIKVIVSFPLSGINEIYFTQQGANCRSHMIFKPKHAIITQ